MKRRMQQQKIDFMLDLNQELKNNGIFLKNESKNKSMGANCERFYLKEIRVSFTGDQKHGLYGKYRV